MFKAIFSSSSSSQQSKAKAKETGTSSSSSKSRTSSPSSSPNMGPAPLPPSRGSSSAMASWTVPPFPHPLPERRIGILPTEQGLLIYPRSSAILQQHRSSQRQHAPHHAKSSTTAAPNTSGHRPFGSGDGFKVATIGTSNVASLSSSPAATDVLSPITSLDVGFLIDWSKDATITPLQPAAWKSILDEATPEQPTLECFGIVGLSRFFSSSYLFVITSSKLIGHYFHDTRPIYCCTAVLAIPLLQQEASQAIRSQLAKQGGAPSAAVPDAAPADTSIDQDTSADESDSESDTDSSESDYDDVETPAAIPKEPFFSTTSSSQRADTLRMPKSRPWLTRAARAVSDGRIQTISEDSAAQSQLADAAKEDADVVEVPQPEAMPQSPVEIESSATTADEPPTNTTTPDQQWHAAKQAELEDKAVRETAKYWARGEFWFSYDFDLTTSLQNKRRALEGTSKPDSSVGGKTTSQPSHQARTSNLLPSDTQASPAFPLLPEPYPNLPLWRRADRRFWHNEHMSKDLIHAGLHAYILPIMQGYLQTVSLPVQPIDEGVAEADASKQADAVLRCQVMVVSRRSKERAGLRYQRRGINEAGQVANFVETEQILYVLRRQSSTSGRDTIGDVLSFVQIRGSIPLYWSQSPFSLKPPPVLERTESENTAACRKHFAAQVDRYGSITCVNLAEQGGKEGQISKAYRMAVENLRSEDAATDSSGKQWDRKKLHYVDFDFHKECAGMKFENVAKLIQQMEGTLEGMGYYHHRTIGGDAKVLNRQTGVFRVSCLDCLDRTNVVQSAFARHVLTGQLAGLGVRVGSGAGVGAAASN